MTENKKLCMENDMRNFQKVKKESEKLPSGFYHEAVEILSALVEAVKDNPYFLALQEEADDFYDESAIVLYAEPGKVAALLEEGEAIDEIMIARRVSSFETRYITEELLAVYPKNYAREHSDGSVFVAGPLYIAHPIYDEDDDEATMDLTAVDFCEAMAYLTTHAVKENNMPGFLLEKED